MKLKQLAFLLIIIQTAFILTAGAFFPLFPLFESNTAFAAEVTLAWDANSESNIAGYKLYYENEKDDDFYGGSDANEGDSPITIYLLSLTDPDSPTYTITGLEEGTYYYFALTAFDTDGMESDFSDEVGVMVDKEKTGGGGGGGGGCFLTCGLERREKRGGATAVAVALLTGVAFLGLMYIKLDKPHPTF